MTKYARVNGVYQLPSYKIQPGDDIEVLDYCTVAQLLEFMDILLPEDKVILVNHKLADRETKVYENYLVSFAEKSELEAAEAEKLRLYEDRMLSLQALYRMEKGLSDALSRKVLLKSGADLVIEPTEALTVIDVNSGKCTKGKDRQETIRKINREAASEIARQMRLRNLSGIILVDFVDMESQEDGQELLRVMRELLKRDPMKAAAVDMTELGLMELTRKKQKKTLLEQAKECGI